MANSKSIGGYQVLSKLGTGAGSDIYLVQNNDQHIYALKHVRKKTSDDQRFIDQAVDEHNLASTWEHSALRKSYKLTRGKLLLRTSEVFVLMEYFDGIGLDEYNPASITELCDIFTHVAEGLGAMHTQGYVHADIKPNNILVGDTSVKIIDFGQSCEIGSIKQRIQGTPDYIAPEQVLKTKITPQTDVFNLGASIYHKLTGKPIPTMIPRNKPGTVGLMMKEKLVPPQEANPQTPPALASLVMACIHESPIQRPKDMNAVKARLTIARRQAEEATISTPTG